MSEGFTIEEFQALLSELVDFERDIRWRLGDIIRRGTSEFGPMVAYRGAAEVLGKSVRWALELAKVAEAFPEEERLPDVDWYMYRVAVNYSEDPIATLRGAVDAGMSPKELKASLDSGKVNPPPTLIKGEFVLRYDTTRLELTPVGALDRLELGEGLEEIPVKATITSLRRKQ